jgi:hypothetical protein
MKNIHDFDRLRKMARMSHKNCSPTYVQQNKHQHNTAEQARDTATNSDKLTPKDLHSARARLFVRGLISRTENERISRRIDRRKP